MSAATRAVQLRARGSAAIASRVLASSVVYGGSLAALCQLGHATSANKGYVKAFSGAAGEIPYGVNLQDVTGATSAPYTDAELSSDGQILESVPVAGVSDITAVGRWVYTSTDNLKDTGDLTLTRPARGVPVGRIVRWYASTTCDVYMLSQSEIFLMGAAQNGQIVQHLAYIGGADCATGDLIKVKKLPHCQVVAIYGVVTKALAGGTSIAITFKKNSTAFTAGGVLTFTTDAAGTNQDATEITQDDANTLSESDTLTGSVVLTGTYTAGGVNVYAVLQPLAGC